MCIFLLQLLATLREVKLFKCMKIEPLPTLATDLSDREPEFVVIHRHITHSFRLMLLTNSNLLS